MLRGYTNMRRDEIIVVAVFSGGWWTFFLWFFTLPDLPIMIPQQSTSSKSFFDSVVASYSWETKKSCAKQNFLNVWRMLVNLQQQ